jgi:hypothetical protein
MCSEHTSHSSGTGLAELVPSRYALRVGEIDVLMVSDGCSRCQPRRWPATPTRPNCRKRW